MDDIAREYVQLVLAVGQHDADYVDAYYGPPEWQEAAKAEHRDLADILVAARTLAARTAAASPSGDDMARLRHDYLTRQLQSLVARVEMLQGRKFSFDEEAHALYDTVPPQYAESHFSDLYEYLAQLLPGAGSITDRYQQFRNRFVIPSSKLDAVFSAAISEARRRTLASIELPAGESFEVEYVRNKPWSGYNWYKGNYKSLIQVNTDLPIFIDYAVDLACHEGYPGHHVYNVMLESNLLRKRNWIEFSVYALYSPQSLVSEGTANFGIEVAFPGPERVRFERDVLFPLAGLDQSLVEQYYKVAAVALNMKFAENEAARAYLNGTMNAETAVRWLEMYALASPERARQRLRFIEKYRSYVINYNHGLHLVRTYIESRGGVAGDPDRRWKEFAALISSPRLPSALS